MGCDIHFFVEARNEDGKWELLPEQKIPCLECSCDFRYEAGGRIKILRDFRSIFPADREMLNLPPEGATKEIVFSQEDVERFYEDCDCCDNSRQILWSIFYKSRNYLLFSILAGVRNHLDIKPISPRRGVPWDASIDYLKEVNRLEGDGHSHSWFTLKEILDFPWDTATILGEAVVSDREYVRWRSTGYKGDPEKLCRGAYGPRSVIVSKDEMDDLLEKGIVSSEVVTDELGFAAAMSTEAADGNLYYARVKYTIYYKDFVEDFLSRMNDLKSRGGPENIRLVFFFDN